MNNTYIEYTPRDWNDNEVLYQQDMDKIENGIANITNFVDDLASTVFQDSSDLAKLASTVSNLRASTAGLNNNVTNLLASTFTLNSNINTISEDLTNLSTFTNDTLTPAIQSIRSTLLNTTYNVNSLEGQVGSIESDINTLNSTVLKNTKNVAGSSRDFLLSPSQNAAFYYVEEISKSSTMAIATQRDITIGLSTQTKQAVNNRPLIVTLNKNSSGSYIGQSLNRTYAEIYYELENNRPVFIKANNLSDPQEDPVACYWSNSYMTPVIGAYKYADSYRIYALGVYAINLTNSLMGSLQCITFGSTSATDYPKLLGNVTPANSVMGYNNNQPFPNY